MVLGVPTAAAEKEHVQKKSYYMMREHTQKRHMQTGLGVYTTDSSSSSSSSLLPCLVTSSHTSGLGGPGMEQQQQHFLGGRGEEEGRVREACIIEERGEYGRNGRKARLLRTSTCV